MKFQEPIAIVGLGGVFPGGGTLGAFWELVASAGSAAGEVPAGRWPLDADSVYDPEPAVADKVRSKRGCYIRDFEFDRSGIDLDSAYLDILDPMFLIGLHAAREAIGSARPFDPKRAGVILGNIALPTDRSSRMAVDLLGRTFEEKLLGARAAGPSASVPRSASSKVAAANRYVAGLPAGVIAKAFGLGGGTCTLDAACASSLYAIKLACDELLSGRADAMLAGGLSRPDCFYTQMGFSQLRAVSPSGVCSPFDARGDGLVVGEGAGMFVLKRLGDALAQGDEIHALLRGAGLSNDLEGNLLAPSSEGQLRAMRRAYEEADWDPRSVGLIECHAAGTPVGDAVEFASLRALWGTRGFRRGACVIGSVKSNVGHLLTAAGAAGMMKAVLAVKRAVLPPTANFSSPPEKIDLENGPFRVLRESEAWDEDGGRPRRAAVSGFGFGGINAHVLIEEYRGTRGSSPLAAPGRPEADVEPIAVVGMGARVGDWKNLRRFQERVLGGGEEHPAKAPKWWGAQSAAWFKERGYCEETFKGHYIESIDVEHGRFRIPPKELAEMLPQQLLMLETADAAVSDAGWNKNETRERTGAFIGIGLDLNTTNFHFRWTIARKAAGWAESLGLKLGAEALRAWTQRLRDAACPPLTADRTMGALGGIVASRIAREFRLGGSCFTVQSEESSGLKALEAAVRALRGRDLDAAVVGAVDLAGDIRAVIGRHAGRPFSEKGAARPFDADADGTVCSDGAAAVVVKRLSDAIGDGDRIYAVVRGCGWASEGGADGLVPEAGAYERAVLRARAESGVSSVGYVETHGSAAPEEDRMEAAALSALYGESAPVIGSAKSDVGHAGAASGLLSFVKAALCLYQEVLPPLRGHRRKIRELSDELKRPAEPSYWLRDRKDGPRRAAVSSMSVDGNCAHAILEACRRGASVRESERLRPLGPRGEALFVARGADPAGVLKSLGELSALARREDGADAELLARRWLGSRGRLPTTFGSGTSSPMGSVGERQRAAPSGLTCAIVARDAGELCRLADDAQRRIGADPEAPLDTGRSFYRPKPLGAQAGVAYLFPGSGNHFPGMGRALSVQWPEALRRQDEENERLAGQYRPDIFWRDGQDGRRAGAEDCIFGQVALGTFVSDVVSGFGIRPRAAIGYSLGESAALFALRAWRDRDEMLARMEKTDLFTASLSGPCEAARKVWRLPNGVPVDWAVGVLNVPAPEVRRALKKRKRAYLLIVNTNEECVIGGDRGQVEAAVRELGGRFLELDGVTTVHCEVASAVKDAYRALHVFKTTPPPGVKFYSGCWGSEYEPTGPRAADAVTEQALYGVDYPKAIEAAYRDGARVFIEMGPGASCTRMVQSILKGRPHLAASACSIEEPGATAVLKTLARLAADGIPFDMDALYGAPGEARVAPRALKAAVRVRAGGEPFLLPPLPVPPSRLGAARAVREENGSAPPAVPAPMRTPALLRASPPKAESSPVLELLRAAQAHKARAHEIFLRISSGVTETMARTSPPPPRAAARPESGQFMDRAACLAFAAGAVGNVLGAEFAPVDAHPTRVRLPDEPLMLVDRILEVEGEARSMTSGRVVTEHDVREDAWYLDGGRIPTCIAVEAGQADLFLSGYLGIDFITKGLAVYRLLDAVVTFHGPLPRPGEVIRYDIAIERFLRQGDTHLFRFRFDGTVDGRPLLTMREGCAGFFTEGELAAGKGIVRAALDKRKLPGKKSVDWIDFVEMKRESYGEAALDALRRGDLAGAFGESFSSLGLAHPAVIPGRTGRMKLIDRVTELDPEGGRFGMGLIRAEADIHPGDWFLTCHFIDDKVMPGTLMYECCLHALRVYLMRAGLLGERGETACEPVLGVASRLKCRGQVVETTRTAAYEITLKELGYDGGGTPYAIADALMYADGKAIVEITDMSVRLSGLTREGLKALWSKKGRMSAADGEERNSPVYDNASILAFAVGKPSEAFGAPYRVFDSGRVIARLPGPPYKFLDRIVETAGEPWKLKAGASAVAQYDVDPGEWYFASNGQKEMPFAVLLEAALQPCGWLAAYLGSALTSDIDLSFRNLGATAVQHRPVGPEIGTLTTRVTMTQVSHSGGMIIQHFDMETTAHGEPVYEGKTYFGFFSKRALAEQVGMRDAQLYVATAAEEARGVSFRVPEGAPFPDAKLRMVDYIDLYVPDGGPEGKGFIRGLIDVDPGAWFFKAHFYQDPVWPGSLGLESFLQALKVFAAERWGAGAGTRFEAVAAGTRHEWVYRGQILPSDKRVSVQALIREIDDQRRSLAADGHLTVDGRVIYAMKNFTVRLS